ncbi:MAG TPA: hypothetical protein VFI27_00815 [candidate division Zixibacteria bacterium]|nr:hypothetical protein [candidate division Zixibacteria bacterium]
MVSSSVLNVVIVIGSVIGMDSILAVFFELRRRPQKKIAAAGENQS